MHFFLKQGIMVKCITNSEHETKLCAQRFARQLKVGDIVFLQGDLGSGKTTFVKGLAQAFNISSKKVTSPTFVLMNDYKGKVPIYHFDLFRLKNPKTIAGQESSTSASRLLEEKPRFLARANTIYFPMQQEIGDIFDEYFYGEGISLIEWPDRLGEHKPKQYYLVEFQHKGEYRRRICISCPSKPQPRPSH